LREAGDGLPAVSIIGLVVKPEVAAAQFAREKAATPSKVKGTTKLSLKDPPAGERRAIRINRLGPNADVF
jgi:hypothetical protein